MIGFVLGAACVIGVMRMMRRRMWRAQLGYAGYGPGACGGYDGRPGGFGSGALRGPWAGRGWRRGGWALRGLFERLETTPGQERAILAALEELRENRRALREEFGQSRADVARAIEGGLVDDATLEETYARHDRTLARLRVSFNEALKKIVEALDEGQRKDLASMLEGRRSFFGWGDGSVWA
jgi:Spy/CpxP family protein refolding chaperone